MNANPVIVNCNYGARGEFDIDVVKVDADGNQIPGTMRRLVDACPNLITNNGLSLLNAGGQAGGGNVQGTVATFMHSCGVGTGNSAPAFTDTSLARVAVQPATTSIDPQWVSGSSTTCYYTRTYTFATGAVVGNISEIGLYVNANANPTINSLLTTRALILVGGTPGSITVLADEQLIVTYRLYVTATIADSVLVTTQKGTEYTLTLRMSNMGLAFPTNNTGLISHAIGPMMANGSGGNSGETYYGATVTLGDAFTGITATSVNTASLRYTYTIGWSYTTVNSYRDDTIEVPLTTDNYADIGAWRFLGNPFFVKVGITPKPTKTNLDKMKFTIRTTVTRA